MEKRFAAFLGLAFLILMLNVMVSSYFAPPPQPPVEPAEAPVAQAPPVDAQPTDKAADAEDAPAAVAEQEPQAEEEVDQQAQAVEAVEAPQRWLTIGSLDPSGPYRMLVTFTNHGAAIRRLELTSDRYNELHNRSGYLGHLQPVAGPDGRGVRVQVVGAGTPAAEAGMQAGDVLLSVDDQEINSGTQLDEILQETRPGQTVSLTVARDGQTLPAMTATLRWSPLAVMGPEARNILERKEELPPDFRDPPSYLLSLAQVGEASRTLDTPLPGVDMIGANWEVAEHDQEQVAFRMTVPEKNLEVIKRFRLAQVPQDRLEDPNVPAYHLDMDVEIRNLGQTPQEVAYRLDGPTGLPTEGWWYASKISRNWGGAGLRDLFVQYEGQSPIMFSPASVGAGDVPVMGQGRSMMFIGIDAQYFASVLIPQKQSLEEVWFQEARALNLSPTPTSGTDSRLLNVSFRLLGQPHTVAPGEPLKQSFTLFAGPKRPDLLAHYGQGQEGYYSLSGLVYYGWPIWAAVSTVMIGILHFFYDLFGNYGIAIVLLTVLVRGLMFPLSRKQALNMVKMQELQPEIRRLQEKYKKDLEKRTKAQQDLFRKHNYNPMGGCLLMFVQLPIFLGLYRALMVDVELRQAPLISDAIRWCSNLSAPDMLYDWSWLMPDFINNGVGIFGLGPYFNILPVVTVALFIGQQKMFMPPPADEQAALQQKLMQYMMVFIGLMFYKVASGLCLYFIASTLWGLAERKFLPKTQAGQAALKAEEPAAPVKSTPSSNGKRRTGRPKRKQK